MKIRPTWILIEDGNILLLDQNVNSRRKRSLPWGSLEEGETLEQWLIREMKEETWLSVKIKKLLYINDFFRDDSYVLHITFLVEKIWGVLGNRKGWVDEEEIRWVKMVPITDIENFGFTEKFKKIIEMNFPKSGNYMGIKSNIGL